VALIPALACVCVVAVGACGQPDDDDIRTRVIGVLPNGTRYELLVPPSIDISEVQGISAVPVWADGPPGVVGYAVGVTNFFSPRLSSSDPPVQPARVTDGRFTVRAGSWGMEIMLHEYSLGREDELEKIQAREQDGLIVIELPPSLRFPELDELPVEISVIHSHVEVVRGCRDSGRCSPDGLVMVRSRELGLDLTGAEVRVLPG
jgi:hypothetical protein